MKAGIGIGVVGAALTCGAVNWNGDVTISGTAERFEAGLSTNTINALSLKAGSSLDVASGTLVELGMMSVGSATEQARLTQSGGTIIQNYNHDPAGPDVGALTLNVPVVVTDEIVVDVRADGTCDLIMGSGSLDVSGVKLRLRDPSRAKGTYTMAVMEGGVTGTFANPVLPNGYKVRCVGGKEIRLGPVGMAVILR